jgi:hypothetical protein
MQDSHHPLCSKVSVSNHPDKERGDHSGNCQGAVHRTYLDTCGTEELCHKRSHRYIPGAPDIILQEHHQCKDEGGFGFHWLAGLSNHFKNTQIQLIFATTGFNFFYELKWL